MVRNAHPTRHLWACDFFTKNVWTLGGLIQYYVLIFIEIGTRRVHIVGITHSPDGPWMAQMARNMCMEFQDLGRKPRYFLRDRDTKFTAQFVDIFKSEGIEMAPLVRRSPNLNAFCESWIGKAKAECLDHFIVFGENHLRHIISEYVLHHNTERPHQSLGNVPIPVACGDDQATPPRSITPRTKVTGVIECRSRL